MLRYLFGSWLLFLAASLSGLEITPTPDGAWITTRNSRVRIANGAIVEIIPVMLKNSAWTDITGGKPPIVPGGLGILTAIEPFREGHGPWGEPTLKQHLPPDFPMVNYYRPESRSRFVVAGTKLQWTGLGNGNVFLPEAVYAIDCREDEAGYPTFRLSGSHKGGKVFSAVLSLSSLSGQAEYIIPGFGGIGYFAQGEPMLMPFGNPPFMEAPLLLAQQPGASLGVWMEDLSMRNFYGFLSRNHGKMSLALEVFTLIPFMNKTAITTPELKLAVFSGDWKNAARPFRDFYCRNFAREIAIRDSVGWAGAIRTIVDLYMQIPDEAILKKVARHLGSDKVLFQVWNARAPNFDQELPDWTPRKGYIEGVERIHRQGMRVMAYVNTYCANYMSPVWRRDNLADFVLTRKTSAWKYTSPEFPEKNDNAYEKLIGTVDRGSIANQFAGIPEGRLLYTDPLSPRWRQYHARMMQTWNTTTHTDANYEDTAGCVTDSGNGVIDGLSAGEGSVAQMRLLQQTQPQVPMSSEFGPAGIAFATSWALNYVGMWGNRDFRRRRLHHQHPVTTYLYGYRQWVSSMCDATEVEQHAMASTSDATGGLGFVGIDFFRQTEADLAADHSWRGHFYRRSCIFAANELKPYFPETDYPPYIRCQYQGKNGIYSYYDDGALQQLLSPQGQPLYGRVNGINRVRTNLRLDNWPLQNGQEIYGLDPSRHYPLFADAAPTRPLPVKFGSFPDRVVMKSFVASAAYLYLEFAALPGGPDRLDVQVELAPDFNLCKINGAAVERGRIAGKLPLRFVALKTGASTAVCDSGDLAGQERKSIRTIAMFRHCQGIVGYPVKVDAPNRAIEVYCKNFQDKYPWHGYDGTVIKVLIDGEEKISFDCLPEPGKIKPDTTFRRLTIPVGQYAGQNLLVSLVSDFKGNTNQDAMFVSIPRLVTGTAVKPENTRIDEKMTVEFLVSAPNEFQGSGAALKPEGYWQLAQTGVCFAHGLFPIDPRKIYRVSGEFQAGTNSGIGTVAFGLAPFDAQDRPIAPSEVNPQPATRTSLTAAAAAGSDRILLPAQSNWQMRPYASIAFNSKEDGSDLPNRELYEIAAIDGDTVKLKKPLARTYAAGTKVCMHLSGNAYIYGGALFRKAPADHWQCFEGLIGGIAAGGIPMDMFWAGTTKARLLFYTNQPELRFRNLRLETMK